MQKLSNIFGSYLPEDNDKDTIVAIPFPAGEKAINSLCQVSKLHQVGQLLPLEGHQGCTTNQNKQ